MNNQQFRRLLVDSSSKSGDGSGSSPKPGATPSAALGSRSRSSIPMTPYDQHLIHIPTCKHSILTFTCNRRTVRGSSNVDFARQLAERNTDTATQKKFR